MKLHSLIVVPYYFFLALSLLPLLVLVCRLLRLKVSIGALVGVAIGMSVAAIAIPLIADWVDLARLSGRPMLLLGLLSFVLAALDAALARVLPLPLDTELSEL